MSNKRHTELSDLTDGAENIYDMTRSLAAIAKQIKADTREETDPPNPVLESIERTFSRENSR